MFSVLISIATNERVMKSYVLKECRTRDNENTAVIRFHYKNVDLSLIKTAGDYSDEIQH